MSRKHTQALVAKSKEVTAFTTATFVTTVTDGIVPPYLVWHPAQGVNESDRLTGPAVTKNPRFTGHLVGETADQVQLLMDLLEAKLFPGGVGVRLSVSGDQPAALWYDSPLPIQVSADPLPAVIYGVVECGWAAEPTA